MPAASSRGGNTGSATDEWKASTTKSRRCFAKPMASATSAASPSNFTAFIIQDSHFSDEPFFASFTASPHRLTPAPLKFTSSPHRPSRSPHRFTSTPGRLTRAPMELTRAPSRLSPAPHRPSPSPPKLIRAPHRLTPTPDRLPRSPQRPSPAPHGFAVRQETSNIQHRTSNIQCDRRADACLDVGR